MSFQPGGGSNLGNWNNNNNNSSLSYSEMTAEQQAEAGAKAMMNFMTSCPGKSVFAGVTGFALGGVFGLFMASMAYDTPLSNPSLNPAASSLPFRQQMKIQFADMGRRSWSSAKSFGFIGAVFTGTECAVESLRARSDGLTNGVVAGCLTGGGLAIKNGPQAALGGCAAFAAFSCAIDYYMKLDSRPPGTTDEDD